MSSSKDFTYQRFGLTDVARTLVKVLATGEGSSYVSQARALGANSSTIIKTPLLGGSNLRPSIRSGSHTGIGARRSNEDQHIGIDDVSKQLGDADQALLDECSISDYCGTTDLTVFILGKHVLIANAGDCRAVISRKGVAKQMTQDNRSYYLQEKKRVEELGGYFEDGYLNEMTQWVLSDDDEFMVIGCDGIWDDVMSNDEAVDLVRLQLIKITPVRLRCPEAHFYVYRPFLNFGRQG
ncbi:PPM-type phosphatase domain, Protein phosphatase 2C family [Artemisia annua]|uniref:PPM-type phosphatase domain, Protein phosphatase 2C family n=1 Tax=Artemisia annua TaxID=35608 RepID=A0A2U1KNX5_ARTAN|nr:PPM-type phosphatase domain, Protein phosphatase 2C family [Artemisia annua]